MTNTFTFVVVLVTIVLVARLIRAYIENRPRKDEASIDIDIEQTLARIDILEERIQVLERIVTESRFDLKSQIDGL